jgi:hypothetical protein
MGQRDNGRSIGVYIIHSAKLSNANTCYTSGYLVRMASCYEKWAHVED